MTQIDPKLVQPDPNNSNYTIPRTWGVYKLSAQITKRFRLGNHPVRQRELERKHGQAELIKLFDNREDAVEYAYLKNG